MNRWTEHQPVTGNVLDAEALTAELTGQSSLMNGNLTRDNLRDGTVTDVMCESQAFHKWGLLSDMQMSSDWIAAYGGSSSLGTTYADGAMGWVPHDQVLSLACTDGIAHIEFDCMAWQNQVYSTTVLQWYQFRLLLDGVPIHEGGQVFMNAHTYRIVVDIPITTGTHEFAVAWRLSSPVGTEGTGTRRMYWFGGQLFVINCFR